MGRNWQTKSCGCRGEGEVRVGGGGSSFAGTEAVVTQLSGKESNLAFFF